MEYKPVPVESARVIGREFSKEIVVIVAWDECTRQIHTTTWGAAAKHKDWAAALGVKLAEAAGADVSKRRTSEDFQEPSTAAKTTERLERLTEALTPSAETKSAYIGEFSFSVERSVGCGSSYMERITVPWSAVKDIMQAITKRAEQMEAKYACAEKT